jgi:hypothetical protein
MGKQIGDRPKERTNIVMDQQILDLLREDCRREYRSLSATVEMAVTEYLQAKAQPEAKAA